MAWDTVKTAPSFHELVAPIVPVADNTAAKLIASNTGTIVQALLHGAEMRQQADLAAKQQMFQAGVKAMDYDMQTQRMENEYELKKAYYDVLGKNAKTNAETNRIRAETGLQRLLQGNQDRADEDMQIAKLTSDVEARAKELKLTDPEFQTKNPVEFAANLQKIKGEFAQAPTYTGIPQKFSEWQTIADQQKVGLKIGATNDLGEWKGGDTKEVPIWKVVKGLQDPNTHDYYKNALAASGHITMDEEQVPVPDERSPFKKWLQSDPVIRDRFFPRKPETKTVTKEKADPLAAGLMEQAGKVDFTPGTSRMPTFVPKSTRTQAAKFGDTIYDPATTRAGRASPEAVQEAADVLNNEAPLPAEDVEPAPLPDTSMAEPTQTDRVLDYARAAIAANPQARAEVVRRLAAMKIDPNLLSAA